jgi:hypothetical protein
VLYRYEGEKFFLLTEKNINKETFIKKARVRKKSFAESIIKRIYDTLTIGSYDVHEEFKKYYSKEYLDLKDFLYKKYNLSKKEIDIILKNFNDKKILLHGDLMNLDRFSVLGLIDSKMVEGIIDRITD